jgi:hypothetical protein
MFAALSTPIQSAAQAQTTNVRHYKLVDIGTLGGPAMFPTKAICGGVDGIVPFIFHALKWQKREFTDLVPSGQFQARNAAKA